MRVNKFVAAATGLSRRAADQAIQAGRVSRDGKTVQLGDDIAETDKISLDGQPISLPATSLTIMLNKPVGYVCSRDGQGGRTVYELLPPEYARLKTVGRLDKDSSGLLIMTDDGDLAQQLTHPSHAKTKIYNIELDRPLAPLHQQMISDHGVQLEDGPSRLGLSKLEETGQHWQVTMREGRNRQIRRSFAALGYTVTKLHRLSFGSYQLGDLAVGDFVTR